MASVSPPKPWERRNTPNTSGKSSRLWQLRDLLMCLLVKVATTLPITNEPSAALPLRTVSAASSSSLSSSSSSSQPPALPSKPTALTSLVSQTASNHSPLGPSRLGAGPYGGYGYNSYSSPYSRFGGMYGGGYGGMYGSYGGIYGGMQNSGDPNSLTHSFNQSTQATFQMIESIVGAFGGFAQMLESTYMATHSSFFAMVSVAEQFGTLRNTLGSVLGIFTVLRWLKTLFARLTGRPLPADSISLTPTAFFNFLSTGQSPTALSNRPQGSLRPSKKPFFFFVAAVFGLPYLMGKLIRTLAHSQELEAKRQQDLMIASGQHTGSIDPSRLDFCRVLYDYAPEAQAASGIDLTVKKGDIVAVLSKIDPMGHPSEWWRCRARDGSVGYLPGPYLQTIQRKPPREKTIAPGDNITKTASGLNGALEDYTKFEIQSKAVGTST
ncbi:Peroxisomal membrane protein PAS20 [Ophidiomyces ophidiicola]|nr:Peroxisomal membrane protein PAS20 [Ophidiomyces ophidiicola]